MQIKNELYFVVLVVQFNLAVWSDKIFEMENMHIKYTTHNIVSIYSIVLNMKGDVSNFKIQVISINISLK